MAKRKSTRRKSTRRARKSDGNSCCPIIRIKCATRKHSASAPAGESLQARLQKYKVEKAIKEQRHVGPHMDGLGGLGTLSRAAGNPTARCTVSIGKRTFSRLTPAKAAAKVAEAMRHQRAKRCNPLVVSSKR